MLNLASILEVSAERFPEKEAFTFMNNALTYREVNEAANKVANGLNAIGIQVGDKVALSCLNLPEFPIIYYGIIKAGAVVVPLSVLLKTSEIAYHLADSEAKAYCCFTGSTELPMGKMGYDAFNTVDSCTDFFMIMPSPEMPSSIEGVPTLAMLMDGQLAAFEKYRARQKIPA
jgi:long-chain acyl-CoA synthetase